MNLFVLCNKFGEFVLLYIDDGARIYEQWKSLSCGRQLSLFRFVKELREDVQINLAAVEYTWERRHMKKSEAKLHVQGGDWINTFFSSSRSHLGKYSIYVFLSEIKNFMRQEQNPISIFCHFVQAVVCQEHFEGEGAYNHNNLWLIKPRKNTKFKLTSLSRRLYPHHRLMLWVWCEKFATFLIFCSSMLCWAFRRW